MLAEWMAYAQLEPFGPPAEWMQAGIVASQIHNVNRTEESQPVAQAQDYLPKAMLDTLHDDDDTLGEQNAQVLQDIRETRHGQ